MRFDTRLKRLELTLTTKEGTEFPENCICFPGNEQPEFGSSAESEQATGVPCPLHGKRFRAAVTRHLYRATRFYRLDFERGWPHRSHQYQKAMRASLGSGSIGPR
jgi:hypothetical protein